MKILLSLDLSTTCTGWSCFNCETGKLIDYGFLKPPSKYGEESISSMKYPQQQLCKMMDLASKIRSLIENRQPTYIVIEEIAGSRQRLGQKVLDGLHWIVLYYSQKYIPIVDFFDVEGADGWRTHLQLRYSDADKLHNKESKKINEELSKGISKIPLIDKKVLAARYVNSLYGLDLNPMENSKDSDIADSIAMGSAWLKFKYTNRG